ncbi:family 78 glycoside hydrolase catalytic domain [Amycolatopsis sp. NPDC058986]|uniref:family 78 glycoside hydrolase catalytic domain n=1 Tax=unclassified Amycolatopsis TaxID=2618356 RepID=UPI003672CF1D
MGEVRRRTALGGVGGAVVLAATTRPAWADPRDGPGPLRAERLTTEHLVNPLGIDETAPRFGWQLIGDGTGRAQSAYQLAVAGTPELLAAGTPDVWDSGKVGSAGQSAIRYTGPGLRSATRYHWAVRVWDEHGQAGPWSDPAWFETALLSERDWDGTAWIGSGVELTAAVRVGSQPTAFDLVALNPGHTLGQDFDSTGPLTALGVPLVATGAAPAGCTLTLRGHDPSGPVLAQRTLTGLTGESQQRLEFAEPLAPGRFYLELAEPRGQVSWRCDATDTYPGGSAYADGVAVTGDRLVVGIPPDPPANPLLRTEFDLPAPVASARLYLAGLGYAVAWANGSRVADFELSPLWTDYGSRVFYTTHDVTALLSKGRNALGIALGRGFFASRIPDAKGRDVAPWTAEPRLRARLDVTLADGTRRTFGSGADWRLTEGPATYEGVYAGESYDARRARRLDGWSSPGFPAEGWRAPAVVAGPGGKLRAFAGEHIRVGAPVEAAGVHTPVPGVRVFDFGVMLAGWARLRAKLPAGTTVRLRYGEKLGPDGRIPVGVPGGFDNPSLVGRFQVDEYTAAGLAEETWQPSGTFKGFQYVEVTGTTEPLELVAMNVGSDLPDTMDLRLEHPELQWLADAFARTARNNLRGLPTDSPAYSKLGWTGDTRFASQSMLYRFGMAGLFGKWLEDLRLGQAPSGEIPILAPLGATPNGGSPSPTWTGVYPQLVRQYWLIYGDSTVPERHFDAVRRYLGWLTGLLHNGISDESLGDWLPPGLLFPPEGGQLVGTAYVVVALRDGAALAELVGHPDLARTWLETAEQVTRRFNEQFYDAAAGVYRTSTTTAYRQTSNAVPLAFGLVPADRVKPVVAGLVSDVEGKGRHLDTGCVGALALPFALSDNGRADLAHAVLEQRDHPSYGYLRSLGATTLWEGWEETARSRDHFMHSGPVQWLVERVLGLEVLRPGWQRFRVAPRAFGTMARASIGLDTVRGRIDVAWRQEAGTATVDIGIPVNATAEVILPRARYELGSGRYRFTTPVG